MMKVEPNEAVDFHQVSILCESGYVMLPDGGRTAASDLGSPQSDFQVFCRALDPNRCFLGALVPNDEDREVFFAARDAVEPLGLHAQATIDRPASLRERWKNYVEIVRAEGVAGAKRSGDAESDPAR